MNSCGIPKYDAYPRSYKNENKYAQAEASAINMASERNLDWSFWIVLSAPFVSASSLGSILVDNLSLILLFKPDYTSWRPVCGW